MSQDQVEIERRDIATILSRSALDGTSLPGPANESLMAAGPFTCPVPLPMLASVQPLRDEGGSP